VEPASRRSVDLETFATPVLQKSGVFCIAKGASQGGPNRGAKLSRIARHAARTIPSLRTGEDSNVAAGPAFRSSFPFAPLLSLLLFMRSLYQKPSDFTRKIS
jgi:hypothetical protein